MELQFSDGLLDDSGHPSFNALQNAAPGEVTIVYYVFDVLVLAGRDVMPEPLATRRKFLATEIMPRPGEPVRESPVLDASLTDLVTAVRTQVLEGLTAKRLNSL